MLENAFSKDCGSWLKLASAVPQIEPDATLPGLVSLEVLLVAVYIGLTSSELSFSLGSLRNVSRKLTATCCALVVTEESTRMSLAACHYLGGCWSLVFLS